MGIIMRNLGSKVLKNITAAGVNWLRGWFTYACNCCSNLSNVLSPKHSKIAANTLIYKEKSSQDLIKLLEGFAVMNLFKLNVQLALELCAPLNWPVLCRCIPRLMSDCPCPTWKQNITIWVGCRTECIEAMFCAFRNFAISRRAFPASVSQNHRPVDAIAIFPPDSHISICG